jgi:hypothetical protein
VFGLSADLIDVRRVFTHVEEIHHEFGPGSYDLGILHRNQPARGHGLAGKHFNFEPDFIFPLFGPNSAHFRKRITTYHGAQH